MKTGLGLEGGAMRGMYTAGGLDVRLEEVCAAREKAGLTVTAVKDKEDWRSVTARKE